MGALVGWFASHHRDLSDRLRIASERDHLTGLLNTRAFDAALTARLEQGRPFGLILADMDNMKDVNDSEGHAVGNDVLRLAGEVLARDREPGDDVARIGGDEFAVITEPPGQRDRPRALQPADGRARGGGHQHELRLGRLPARRRDVLLLFRAADERLYAQKLIRSRLTSAEVVAMPSRAERLALRSRTG